MLARSALPKTGPWMENVKRAFGVMLLAVAVWLVSPVLPGVVTMLAWAAILVVSAIYPRPRPPAPRQRLAALWKGWGVIALLAGAAMFIGAWPLRDDPLQPLAILRGPPPRRQQAKFQRVRSVEELDQILKTATRPVMLDFYADWCISCNPEMERFTFADPAIARRLAGFQLIQADVTANNGDDKALLKRFNLFGPPGIIFFDATGAERKQLARRRLQEAEMPGLMAIRDEFAKSQPLKGARITGSLHMTIQTAVLIETLQALGADVRWASCNIFSTQDHAAAASPPGIPVFAVKGESWWITGTTPTASSSGPTAASNMILDDGGDATLLLHLGAKGREGHLGHRKPRPGRRNHPLRRHQGQAGRRPDLVLHPQGAQIKGVTEGNHHRRASPVPDAPARRRSSSPPSTSMILGHQVQVRQPLRLPRIAGGRHQSARHRRDDRRQGRRGLRLRRRGQGLGPGPARARRPGVVTEIDPICALQAAMEGYRVVTMEYAAEPRPTSSSPPPATSTSSPTTTWPPMKDQAIVCNIGHFDNEIDVASIEKYQWEEIKPQVDHVIFPDGKRIILLAKGRLVNLGCGTGHPSYVMSSSFANQTIAQIELFTRTADYPVGVTLPKHLDEKVARPAQSSTPSSHRAHRRAGRLHQRGPRKAVQGGGTTATQKPG